MPATPIFDESKHPRTSSGKFAAKAPLSASEETSEDVKAAASAEAFGDEMPAEYRWGVPDWLSTPSPEDSPTVAFMPTARQALQIGDDHSGEFIDITYVEPGTGERDELGRIEPGTGVQRTARGRLTKDDSGNLVVYGEPGTPSDGFDYGANEYIRIPSGDVVTADADIFTMAVGSPDDTEMIATSDPERPGIAYDEGTHQLHVRTSSGAVVTYWPVPESHADFLAENPSSAHGRYHVAAVFAPDRTRVDLGGGRSARYSIATRELTVNDKGTVTVHEDVSPGRYAEAFAKRSPSAALRSLADRLDMSADGK